MSRRHRKNQNQIWQSFAMVSQFGITMIVPILLCTLAGGYLGNWLKLSWLSIPFFLIGAAAGFTGVYRLARDIFQDQEKKNGKEDKHD